MSCHHFTRSAARHAIAGDVRAACMAAADALAEGFERDRAYAALVRAEPRTK